MMTIKVEPNAGDKIENTFKEAVALANKLRCYVEFDFNGVACIACPGGDPKKGASAYFDAIQSKDQYKLAMS
jgi:hypothetical protein